MLEWMQTLSQAIPLGYKGEETNDKGVIVLKALLAALFAALMTYAPAVAAQEFNPNAGNSGNTDINPTDVIIWNGINATADDQGNVNVSLRLETRDNFSIYKSKLELRGPSGYSLAVKTEPIARKQDDPLGEGIVEVYDAGDFELSLKGDKAYTDTTLSIFVTFLGCTQSICLFPYTQELKIPVYKGNATAAPTESDTAGDSGKTIEAVEDDAESAAPVATPTQAVEATQAIDATAEKEVLTFEEQYAERLKSGELPFALLLLVIFLGGIATNLTPCVFPMIPITLRLLARQGHKPLPGTLLYASGIIVTYTALGIAASLSGGLFGSILANTWVNVAFALIFLLLGITMLGFGNLSKLQNLGALLGSGKSSHLNSFGMGAGAGLVAAPCTGPIMGALLAYSTQLGDPLKSLLLFFLYSLGFALPYVFLGLAANRVTAFKVGPRIQVAIKMVFAAAMFGLAAYYLKNPVYEALRSVNGHWLTLTIVFGVLGLLGVAVILRSSHLMHTKHVQLLPSFLLGLALFAMVQRLTGNDLVSTLNWFKDEKKAYEFAAATGKPMLVDGWADWCVACKDMEKTTFQDPAVISVLQDNFVLVKLDLTSLDDPVNEALAQKYDMQGLPTLVFVPSNGDMSGSKKITGFTSAERLLQEMKAFQGR